MAKPEAWQLIAENYPFTVTIQTRWADLDQLGHINNVSMAGLFEEGRGRFTHSLRLGPISDKRWLIAGVEIAYLAEAFHPQDMIISTGVDRVGSSSWTLASAAFQGGRCVATCKTVTVFTDANGAAALPESFRVKLSALMAGKVA